MQVEIRVPDIGDFKNIPIIEIHVQQGAQVRAEDPLITLESDKATMDVPAPLAGTVAELKVALGDKVSEGDLILRLEAAGTPATTPQETVRQETGRQETGRQETGRQDAAAPPGGSPPAAPSPKPPVPAQGDMHAELLVLGAGPGGYSAAFRAADLGMNVVLVERWDTLGGVCLNVGCIPSKALLHAAKVVEESRQMGAHGIRFAAPEIDLDKLRGWKDGVVKRLTGGLSGLAKQRKVTVVQGSASFLSPNQVQVAGPGGAKVVSFEQAIIAAGSEPVTLPFIPHADPRVIDSTGALAMDGVPERLLVLGGGIIGLEMATVYHALGSKVTVVELMDQIIPGVDKDIVTPLMRRISRQYAAIHLKSKVTQVEATPGGLVAHFEGGSAPPSEVFDKILVAVGRRPNGKAIGAENAGVRVDERGFITVDKQQRTNVPHIFAIGDIVGQPMLAHKAVHEGHVAAEVAAGHKAAFDAKVIPSVAYTDPEVAWVGLTENEAKARGVTYGKAVFPWAASGRSLSLGRDEGLTKLLFDEATHRVIGCGIVGPNAGDLIAEVALAIEMGADAVDIGATIHPHPTLSETIGMAAEMFEGTITDLIPPKRR
jgi:dihydrolipoamide dehydrogenase